MVDCERELQGDSMESKIIEIDFDFTEKLKFEVGDNFRNLEFAKITKIK